jgi:FkbM family methyltransferase
MGPNAYQGSMSLRDCIRAAIRPAVRSYIRYCPVPWFKCALYNRVFWQKVAFTTRTKCGTILSGSTDDLIQRYVYYFGVWEPNLTAWLMRTLRSGAAFIDVGANIGYYSLLASRYVGPDGLVVAVEASPIIFQRLLSNIARNGGHCHNVTAVNCAIGESCGQVVVHHAASDNIGATSISSLSDAPPQTATVVPVAPLADVIPYDIIDRIQVVKIDVEGSELQVIRGMTHLLNNRRFTADIVVEVSPTALSRHGATFTDFRRLLSSAGYMPYEIENSYSYRAYARGNLPVRPRRLAMPPTTPTDLIFSKRNTPFL